MKSYSAREARRVSVIAAVAAVCEGLDGQNHGRLLHYAFCPTRGTPADDVDCFSGHMMDETGIALQPLRAIAAENSSPPHSCPGCFRLERLPGGTCTLRKALPLHGARQEQTCARVATNQPSLV